MKRIVELHNGEIRVESGVNVGTTFIFTLPTIQACPEAEAALH